MSKVSFHELRDQILDVEKWDMAHFHVFGYEAGTGKSRSTHQILGEMTIEYSHRVLYVQRFARDNELDDTVDSINYHAGRHVAEQFVAGDKDSLARKQNAKKAQILCVTHMMYIQICKGFNPYLIEDRDILIIDEFPDLIEKISVSMTDIGTLWAEFYKYNIEETNQLAENLREILHYNTNINSRSMREMVYTNFESIEYEIYKSVLKELLSNHLIDKNHKVLIEKFSQILNNGCYIYEGMFHTFNNEIKIIHLKNNIILDANAEFDYRYKLTDRFIVKKQDKVFDYSNSVFKHFEVKTGKGNVKKYNHFHEKIMDTVSFANKGGILFVTDKENVDGLTKDIDIYFKGFSKDLNEIEETIDCKISVDYFGNIIGVNTYRDYDAIVVIKTPYYDYLTYVLTYFYHSFMSNEEIESVEIFKHFKVESIRSTTIAGEFYQAIKRINRENSKDAEVYLFADYSEAVNIVLDQLPGIMYEKKEIIIEQIRKEYDSSKRKGQSKVEKVKQILVDSINLGVTSIRKEKIRKAIGVKDKSNFTKILTNLQPFFLEHGITSNGQNILFTEIDNLSTHQEEIVSA